MVGDSRLSQRQGEPNSSASIESADLTPHVEVVGVGEEVVVVPQLCAPPSHDDSKRGAGRTPPPSASPPLRGIRYFATEKDVQYVGAVNIHPPAVVNRFSGNAPPYTTPNHTKNYTWYLVYKSMHCTAPQ